MERNPHYFAVGLFVSIALVAMVAFVVWLAGTHDTRRYDKYTIYFTDSVSGLNEGANVQYQGVQVGKVLDIRLAPARNDLIKVDIEVNDDTPVHSTTNASLATLGVTGLVFIQLTTPVGDHSPPKYMKGEKYPVIEGSGSALTKLLQDVPKINQRVLDIANRIDSILTPENAAAITATLQNANLFTHNMAAFTSPENVANASTSLKNLADSSENFGPTIQAMKDATAKFTTTVTNANAILVKNQANIDRFSDQGLRQITDATRQAADMTRSIKELADKLKQNPSQIIYKPGYEGVEVRK